MKTLLFSISLVCISIFATAQTDSLATYLNMSFEELLKQKVTTVSKFTEPIFLAPANMSVVSAKEIESFGANNLTEILDRVTSMYSCGSYFTPQGIIAMRGTITTQFNTHILILLNGRPLRESAQSGNNIAIYDVFPIGSISQIEVIKGSGSVLYGSNAYSGIVNIITKDISEKTQADAKFKYGTFGTTNSSLLLSKKIGEFKIQTNAVWNRTNGWDFTARGETDLKKVNGVDVVINPPKTIQMAKNAKSLLFEADFKGLRATFLGIQTNYNYMNGNPVWSNPIQNEMELTQYFSTLSYEKSWNKFELKSHVGYNYSIRHQLSLSIYNPSYVTQYSNSPFSEVSLAYKASEKFKFLGGVSFSNSFMNTISYRQDTLGKAFNKFDTEVNSDPYYIVHNKSENSYNAYFQVSYYPFSFLNLDVGGQLNKTESLKLNFVPKLNAVLHWSESVFIKLIYGNSYRAPSLDEKYSNTYYKVNSNYPPITYGGGKDLNPENIRTAEIQVNIKLQNAILSLAYFDSKEKDLITRSLPSDSLVIATAGEIGKKLPVPKYINMGLLNSKGLEFEGKFNILQKFYVTSSYSIFKIGNGNQPGMGMPNSMFKVGASYELPIRQISVGVYNSYFGKGDDIDAIYPNANPKTTAYNFLTANIRMDLKHLLGVKKSKIHNLILEIYGTNLLNEQIYYPEYIRKTINSLPGRAGRAIYFSLNVGI